MLIIEVTNARDVVRQQIGRLGERLIGKVADAESQVENALIQEMENAFQEVAIEARILSVKGPLLDEGDSLQIPLHVREARDITLNTNEE